MNVFRHAFPVVLMGLLSGCLPMYYGNSVTPAEVVAGKNRAQLADELGQPVRTVEFSPPVRLAAIPEFRLVRDRENAGLRVRWRDEFRCRANIRVDSTNPGGLSERELVYINTLGFSEVVAAPVIAVRDLHGQTQSHELVVWSGPDGKVVFHTFDGK